MSSASLISAKAVLRIKMVNEIFIVPPLCHCSPPELTLLAIASVVRFGAKWLRVKWQKLFQLKKRKLWITDKILCLWRLFRTQALSVRSFKIGMSSFKKNPSTRPVKRWRETVTPNTPTYFSNNIFWVTSQHLYLLPRVIKWGDFFSAAASYPAIIWISGEILPVQPGNTVWTNERVCSLSNQLTEQNITFSLLNYAEQLTSCANISHQWY